MAKLDSVVYPPESKLQFGDILLKSKGSPLNTITKLKTWSDVSHSELYVGTYFSHGESQVITAFPEHGVNFYPYKIENTVYILRPHTLPTQAGFYWFQKEALGQGYDYLGMAAFFFAQLQGGDNGKQFCSEVIARLFKKGDAPLLHPRIDADAYAPSSFKTSPLVDYIWEATEG